MKVRSLNRIALSPIAEVNAMLAADKVQNKKDFMLHLFCEIDGAPDRVSARCVADFNCWLERLGESSEV